MATEKKIPALLNQVFECIKSAEGKSLVEGLHDINQFYAEVNKYALGQMGAQSLQEKSAAAAGGATAPPQSPSAGGDQPNKATSADQKTQSPANGAQKQQDFPEAELGLSKRRDGYVAICSNNLLIKQIPKFWTDKKVRETLQVFGAVERVDYKAFLNTANVSFKERKAAATALIRLKKQPPLSVVWDTNSGIANSYFKKYWDGTEGTAFIPSNIFPWLKRTELLAGGALLVDFTKTFTASQQSPKETPASGQSNSQSAAKPATPQAEAGFKKPDTQASPANRNKNTKEPVTPKTQQSLLTRSPATQAKDATPNQKKTETTQQNAAAKSPQVQAQNTSTQSKTNSSNTFSKSRPFPTQAKGQQQQSSTSLRGNQNKPNQKQGQQQNQRQAQAQIQRQPQQQSQRTPQQQTQRLPQQQNMRLPQQQTPRPLQQQQQQRMPPQQQQHLRQHPAQRPMQQHSQRAIPPPPPPPPPMGGFMGTDFETGLAGGDSMAQAAYYGHHQESAWPEQDISYPGVYEQMDPMADNYYHAMKRHSADSAGVFAADSKRPRFDEPERAAGGFGQPIGGGGFMGPSRSSFPGRRSLDAQSESYGLMEGSYEADIHSDYTGPIGQNFGTTTRAFGAPRQSNGNQGTSQFRQQSAGMPRTSSGSRPFRF